MNINSLTTQIIDWDSIPVNELPGTTGKSLYKEIISGGYRIRRAEYLAGYSSAEWCDKGHIIYCIKGTLTLNFKNREADVLTEGNSIILGADDHHTASTGSESAIIFIVDNI